MVKTKTKVTPIPVADCVVIWRDKAEAETEGGILLPDCAKDKPSRGTVIAVGPGAWHNGQRQEMQVQLGDKVVFGSYSATDVEINEQECCVLREKDILFIVRE